MGRLTLPEQEAHRRAIEQEISGMGLKNHCPTDCRGQCMIVKMGRILTDVVRI